MADTPVITARDVHRSFANVHAVRGATFSVDPGTVTALVGPNGCGKSTLMLMLAGLLAPDSGTIEVHGYDPEKYPAAVKSMVGWMPDQLGAWDSLTVREILEVAARSYFVPRADRPTRIQETLELLDLASMHNQAARILSRGQKQRLGLASALVHHPSILILDEPASGLDPRARRRLMTILRDFAQRGGTVIISSHILSELEDMADAVVFMREGDVVAGSEMDTLASTSRLWRVMSLDAEALRRAMGEMGVDPERWREPSSTLSGHAEAYVRARGEDEATQILAGLALRGARIVSFAPEIGRLESAYLTAEDPDTEGPYVR